MRPLYEEKQKSTWIRAIMVAAVLVIFLTVLIELRYSFDAMFFVTMTIIIVVDGLLLYLLWEFKVSIDGRTLSFGYRLMNKRISILDIKKAEPYALTFWMSGVGVHYTNWKTWTYNSRLGKGIRIELKDGKNYVFSTDHPEKVLSLINKRK